MRSANILPRPARGLMGALALLLLGACGTAARSDGEQAAAGLVAQADDPDSWATHGGSYLEQRFSPLDQINDGNVGTLKLAWHYDLDTARGQEGTPLMVEGVLYVTTAWSKVKALDAVSGKLLWEFDPQVPGATAYHGCCDVVNRGAAYYDGRIYFASLDGRLFSLDAETGAEIWSIQTVDKERSYTITGAPRVAHGKVFIGNSGAEYGVRGYVSAYDAKSGKLAWRFYTVPGKGRDGAASDDAIETIARKTWHGDKYLEFGGGGTVWDAIVYDEKYNQLLIGIGNGSPWNHQLRSEGNGDNLFLSSIVALDPDTGAYRWHFQETPGETWDFTATQQITLATLQIDGKPRDVLMQAPKNGFFYVLDRKNGQFISAESFVPMNWATGVDPKTGRPMETREARAMNGALAMPGAPGAHNWNPMSFSPDTGLVYIPAQEIPYAYARDDEAGFKKGRYNLGVDWAKLLADDVPTATPEQVRAANKGYLLAWDPVAQREVWRVDLGEPGNGGTLATAGNLVFEGTNTGQFRAFAADSGKPLWSFEAQDAIMGGPITYRIGGKQYVAVLAGAGGAFWLATNIIHRQRAPNGRVLVFSLEGKDSLPELGNWYRQPPSPAKERFTRVQLDKGRELYLNNCMICHGNNASGAGVTPELRRSPVVADKDVWKSIVVDGALADNGMVGFEGLLSPEDADAIRGFVSSKASELARAERIGDE